MSIITVKQFEDLNFLEKKIFVLRTVGASIEEKDAFIIGNLLREALIERGFSYRLIYHEAFSPKKYEFEIRSRSYSGYGRFNGVVNYKFSAVADTEIEAIVLAVAKIFLPA